MITVVKIFDGAEVSDSETSVDEFSVRSVATKFDYYGKPTEETNAFDFLAHYSPIVTDLTDNVQAWKELLEFSRSEASKSPASVVATPTYYESSNEFAVPQYVRKIPLPVEVVSRCTTPDVQTVQPIILTNKKRFDSDDISVDYDIEEEPATRRVDVVGTIVPSTPLGNNANIDDDNGIVSLNVAVPATPTVVEETEPKNLKRKDRNDDDNIIIDLRSESDDDDNDDEDTVREEEEKETPKRRKIEVAPADDDSDDDEEVIRYILYNGGSFAKVDKKSTINVLNAWFKTNNIQQLKSIGSVTNKIGTLFCIYDDAYEESQQELLNDNQLVNLAMEGRVRMTPLSALMSTIDNYGYEQLNVDALRHCSHERRHEITKVRAYIDTTDILHSRWRLAASSLSFKHGVNPIVKTKAELFEFLKTVLFTSK